MDNPALNQSTLKSFLLPDDQREHKIEKGEDKIFKEDPVYFTIGGAVDMLLTGFEGDFEKTYHISTLTKRPSDAIINIINTAIEGIAEVTDSIDSYREEILQACLLHNYQPNYKDETKINKIVELGAEYFEELKLSYGKKILSADDVQIVEAIVDGIKNKYSMFFDISQNSEDVDVYFQKPLYFNYFDIDCKALPDMIVVKKKANNQPVITVYDFKTTSDYLSNFYKTVMIYRYDIQHAWYKKAVQSSSLFLKCCDYSAKFIVASKLYAPHVTEVFTCSGEFLDRAVGGSIVSYPVQVTTDGNFVKTLPKSPFLGVKQLIDKYKNNILDIPNHIPTELL